MNKEKKAILNYVVFMILVFCAALYVSSCAFTRQSEYHLYGNNIKTPYGTGDVNVDIKANTTWGMIDGNSQHNSN